MLIHFTTVHPRHDTRIRVKEVGSLADSVGKPVVLYVQDGKGTTEDPDGISIVDTRPRPRGRLARMTRGAPRFIRLLLICGFDGAFSLGRSVI